MDLVAALGLVMVIEGLALVIFARSVPALLMELDQIGARPLRLTGALLAAGGVLVYLFVRGSGSGA